MSKIYIRLGARASSFHDFASKVSLSGKDVLELPATPDSKFFKKALHAGHIVLCSKVDYDEFIKSTSTGEAKASNTPPSNPPSDEEFIYVAPQSSTKEDIALSLEVVKDFKTLIKWCESFGFEKEDMAIVKKLKDTDLAEAKLKVTDLASEYEGE